MERIIRRALGSLDPYANVATWNTETAQSWIRALELRADSPEQRHLRRFLAKIAHVSPGDTVVEVGCGTGALLLDLITEVGKTGKVIGIEPQRSLLAVARAKLEAPHEVMEGRAECIPLDDGVAAATFAQTVLIHLPLQTALLALKEMARVTRPAGCVVSIDHDGDTWIVDHPNRELTRRIVHFNSDQRFADGWRGRQLRRLFTEAGLTEVTVSPWVHMDTARPSYLFSLAERIANAAKDAQVISAEECNSWLDELNSTADRGLFFSSITFFIAVGQKNTL